MIFISNQSNVFPVLSTFIFSCVFYFFFFTTNPCFFIGKAFSQEVTFGQYPLNVLGFRDIHESLEATTAQGEIETVSGDSSHKSGQEVSGNIISEELLLPPPLFTSSSSLSYHYLHFETIFFFLDYSILLPL